MGIKTWTAVVPLLAWQALVPGASAQTVSLPSNFTLKCDILGCAFDVTPGTPLPFTGSGFSSADTSVTLSGLPSLYNSNLTCGVSKWVLFVYLCCAGYTLREYFFVNRRRLLSYKPLYCNRPTRGRYRDDYLAGRSRIWSLSGFGTSWLDYQTLWVRLRSYRFGDTGRHDHSYYFRPE